MEESAIARPPLRSTTTKAPRRYEEANGQESLVYSYVGQCGECANTINGTLYACRICPGYEWCEECVKDTEHPIDHPFLRVSLQEELLAEGQLKVEIEGKDARDLWETCKQFSPRPDAVPFLTLVDQLSKHIKEDITHGEVVALEAIFGDISHQKEISVNSLDVTDLEFALFVKRFGPMHLCVKKVMQVITDGRVWFHGNMDLHKAATIFRGKPDRSFIIRYSSRTPGAFSINYVKDNEMKIFNRISNNMDGEGLYVHSDKQKLHYSSFAAFIKSNAHIFAQPVEDPLNSFLLVKKKQLQDMGTNCNLPFTFNNPKPVRSPRLSSSVDDFYDAVARKADGFATQMACSPPPASSTSSRVHVPMRRSKSVSPSGEKTHRHSHHHRKHKHKHAPRKLEEEEHGGAAHHGETAAAVGKRGRTKAIEIPVTLVTKSGRKPFVPGAHYSSFYSDDEDEELPNIVA